MTKPNIAVYLQHYLSPSMTFIYRQLLGVQSDFTPVVLSSHKIENLDIFPFESIYFKSRNFRKIKTSKAFNKIYGQHKLLSRNPRISQRQKKYFTSIFSKNNIRLIHAHFGPSGIEILLLAKRMGIPLLVSFHGYDGSILLNFQDYIKNLNKLFELAHIIVPSHYMLNELEKKVGIPNNYSIINYGIPLKKFKLIKRTAIKKKFERSEKITFLQVSNFVEKKGHFYTVSAFRDFLNLYENAELVLGGDGDLKYKIENLVNKLGISNKVIFKGRVNHDQVTELMENADVFLHHSVTSKAGDKEGIPNALMEAMATGLPCISTEHAGIPELIKDGVNGFLIKERDVNGYVQKMIDLLKQESNISAEARKTIERNFNLEIQVNHLKKIYVELIK
jgi:glycosyltransferase involved in cell wall biosynthesis